MVKVLNIITSGLAREGITTTQLEYMKHLDMNGIQMDMASVYEASEDVVKEFENYGCNVIQLPNRTPNCFKYTLALYKQIKKEKYNIIHVHGSSSLMVIDLLIARFAGVKNRVAHSRNTTCVHEVLDKILRPIFYKSYNYALACGKDAGEWLFPGQQYTVLHNGKDLSKFRYDEHIRTKVRNTFHLGNKVAIGFVGNLIYQKNPEFLIDVFAAYHNKNSKAVLFIMGDGEERVKLKQLVETHGIKNDVIFTGRIANINEMLQAMDIMLLPSHYEGLPNVVLEWQISGLPSIVSNNVTQECKVTDLVSFLPINNGCEQWISSIEELLKKSDRVKDSEFACECMKKAKFDINENSKYLKELYEMMAVSTIK